MRIAVYGSGAVGGYFGGRLAQAGEDVCFIARGAHLEALRERGLRIDSPKGDLQLHPVQATDRPEEIGPVDLVLIGVKAWQTPTAAEAIRPLVHDRTRVLPLQNGVEAADQLAAVLGEATVLGGLCKIISLIAGPGHIHHVGSEPYIAVGERDRGRSASLDAVTAVLKGAGITTVNPPDIHVAVWEKFLFIASFSGVGAVTRVPAGALREMPETRALLQDAMHEIMRVAEAKGIRLAPDTPAKTLAFIDGLPEEATASMQRDLMEGRPSELESQNGAVVRLGESLNVATPVNRFIYHAMLPLERLARARIE